jgi:hypothetical protein
MMALSRKMPERDPDEVELLLPWYAAGTLNAHDMKRVDEALARDAGLATQYAAIRQEYAETIALNETLGAPSMRPMHRLFAAIDAEPSQAAAPTRGPGARILRFFASLSPRALVWSTGIAAVLVLAQAGIIGAVLLRPQPATFQTASLEPRTPAAPAPMSALTRALGVQPATSPVRLLVRFAPDARISDITALLNSYQASIIEGAKGGMFTLQVGDRPMSKEDADGLLARLQREKIVSLAVLTP